MGSQPWSRSIGTLHYETASTEVINDGFKGLARELREVADEIEAIAPQARQQTNNTKHSSKRLLSKGCGIGAPPLAHVRGGAPLIVCAVIRCETGAAAFCDTCLPSDEDWTFFNQG